MNKTIVYGQILALLASMCGAYSSIVYSRIGKKVDSDILAFVRMTIAFPIMILWAFITDGFAMFHVPLKDIVFLFSSGLVGFFITDLFLFRAYTSYGANQTMVVMCLTPILSSLMSALLFHEILESNQYIAIGLTVMGVIAVTGSDMATSGKILSYGLICAFISALFQSGADMLAKAALTELPHTSSSAIRAFAGLVGWAVFAKVKLKGKIRSNETLKKPAFMGLFFVTVIIGTIVGTTFAVGSLKYAPGGIATSLKQISPVFILPYDIIVLKKRSRMAVTGTFITVLGVVLFFI